MKKLIFLLFLIVTIFLTGCVCQQTSPQQTGSGAQDGSGEQTEDTANVAVSNSEAAASAEITTFATSLTEEIERCENIDDLWDRRHCFAALALERNNPALCDDQYVDFTSISNDCYFQLALKYKNKGYCEKIYLDDDLKNQCQQEVG